MKLYFSNQQDLLPCTNTKEAIHRIVSFVLLEEKQHADEVSISFVDADTICRLHLEHFDDPSLTDCCTFPIDVPGCEYCMLGEVVVCPFTALTYAQSHQSCPYEELTRYIVHGVLHLLGYRDMEEIDRSAMKKREEALLAHLGSKGWLLSPLEGREAT